MLTITFERRARRGLIAAAMVGAIGVFGGAGGASAEDYVILDSTAAGIEPGLVIAADADLIVPEGAEVMLIDPNGGTLIVRGPYGGLVAAAAGASSGGVGDALNKITTPRGQDTSVLGAVRAPKIDGGSVTE